MHRANISDLNGTLRAREREFQLSLSVHGICWAVPAITAAKHSGKNRAKTREGPRTIEGDGDQSAEFQTRTVI